MKKVLKISGITLLITGLIVVIIGFIALKNTFLMKHPEAKDTVVENKWYRITPENTESSDGSEWHGMIKPGKEKNKVIVYFFGGGVSITPETSIEGTKFYAINMFSQDFVSTWGIGSNKEINPFRDWTVLVLPYSTGDFHVGTEEYKYTDNDEKEKVIYHTGYNNYSAFMQKAKQYINYDDVDTLLVTGFSAGGFATSLLADDVIDYFPNANNTTVAVDSSLLLYDEWNKTATELWKAPSEIRDRLTSNNIVLDSLVALNNKRGDNVKILFDCSVRDNTLQQYQGYIDNGKMEESKENSDKFQKDLKQMVKDLQDNVDNVGIYIWENGLNQETKSTQHTIISSNLFDKLESNTSIADWLINAVNGNVKSYGLELLDKKY